MRPIFSIRDKPSPSCVECEYCVECECVSKVQYLVMLLSQVYDKTAWGHGKGGSSRCCSDRSCWSWGDRYWSDMGSRPRMHTDKPTHTIAALVPSASASSLGMSSIGQNSTTPGDVVPEGDEVDEFKIYFLQKHPKIQNTFESLKSKSTVYPPKQTRTEVSGHASGAQFRCASFITICYF